ncbi:MAG TPA: FixG Ig-like domain-containing protein, partial [Telluria sp.]|nr:FixG Ig-like domain-containing protein [Telluria sp.]
RYVTEYALENKLTNKEATKRVFRPRVLIYSAILLVLVSVMVGTLAMRTPLKLDVIRDRGSMGREVDGEMIENVYRLQVMNTTESKHAYRVEVGGLPSVQVMETELIEVPAATTRAVPIRVRVPESEGKRGSNKIKITLTATDDPSVTVTEKAVFIVPR